MKIRCWSVSIPADAVVVAPPTPLTPELLCSTAGDAVVQAAAAPSAFGESHLSSEDPDPREPADGRAARPPGRLPQAHRDRLRRRDPRAWERDHDHGYRGGGGTGRSAVR